MSRPVQCQTCRCRSMRVIPREDQRPALWCADCGEPVAYPDGDF